MRPGHPVDSSPAATAASTKPWMTKLVRSLLQPYRRWVLIIFAAMMVETLAKFLELSWDKSLLRVQAPTGSHHESGHALAAAQSED